MQHQDCALSKEDSVVHWMILNELKGMIKVGQDFILDIVEDHYSPQVIEQVKQAIAPCSNPEQLRKFFRQLARLPDDQKVLALLTECFPQGERKGKIEGRLDGLREAILDVAFDLFSLPAVVHVNYVTYVCYDAEQLRKFHRQMVQLSDEEELVDLILECFPLCNGIEIFTAKEWREAYQDKISVP
jgi:hypothetical protein